MGSEDLLSHSSSPLIGSKDFNLEYFLWFTLLGFTGQDRVVTLSMLFSCLEFNSSWNEVQEFNWGENIPKQTQKKKKKKTFTDAGVETLELILKYE